MAPSSIALEVLELNRGRSFVRDLPGDVRPAKAIGCDVDSVEAIPIEPARLESVSRRTFVHTQPLRCMTTAITGWRQLTLISKHTGHRDYRAWHGHLALLS